MSLLSLLDASKTALAALYASLSPDWEAVFLGSPLHLSFFHLFHLLMYDVTVDVYCSGLMCAPVSLNMCQSVHSIQSRRAAVASAVNILILNTQ